MNRFRCAILLLAFFTACTSSNKKTQDPQIVKVELSTDMGNVILELSNETPLHRDNFVKLVNDGYFDGMLFHRVINGFGIQSGDPDSKTAAPGDTLGNGGPGYTIPSEINGTLYHKRGAILAARDNNPARASSGSQFFIVQGKVQTDSILNLAEKRINGWLAEHAFINDPHHKTLRDALQLAIDSEDEKQLSTLSDSIKAGAENYSDFERYSIPEAHREVYKTSGGAPHLDQNYTVFGEVIKGMNVVDSIATLPVDPLARPLSDIRIISAKILADEN
ncbi:peptidylprolyl isomerase [Maribellus sp. YY47]|uniref:peptidylprolyl isomerase n=1 Tax=Maribellus sp. YY47 TaxID=2929486 RepID=UPI002000B44B|nr:peptidylprolyl isomerase [Maribellus sp. YY47]MCK3685806.1 peptidylprolyl isomerase [Maribellus sp. YY47]